MKNARILNFHNSEIENSEKKLIRLVQSYHLPDAKSSNYIETYIDNEGILRVKTKILNRDDEGSFLYPILLPEKFKSMSSEPTPLPPDRVADCAPFEIVGIDLGAFIFERWKKSGDNFVYLRGRPRTIYCDSGTNFRGAFNDLSKLNWCKIVEETRTPKILWKFIPPTAVGGEDGGKGWSALNEYLSQLIQKHNEKQSREPQIGEVVLVGNDNKKRLFWALAKIIELIPGRDGKIHTVRLKTQHGKMLRPIQLIYLLERYAQMKIFKEVWMNQFPLYLKLCHPMRLHSVEACSTDTHLEHVNCPRQEVWERPNLWHLIL
ncbi:integrase catalytic domain-containing protein [Trichonephila clavipes]|nr:integrase catalytic domain-containing protein [Trichonephila clavipes]